VSLRPTGKQGAHLEVPRVQVSRSAPPQVENTQGSKRPSLPLGACLQGVEVAVRKAFFISELYAIYVGIVKENKQ